MITIPQPRREVPLPDFLANLGCRRVPPGTRIETDTMRGYCRFGFDEHGSYVFFHDQQGWLYGNRGKAWIECRRDQLLAERIRRRRREQQSLNRERAMVQGVRP